MRYAGKRLSPRKIVLPLWLVYAILIIDTIAILHGINVIYHDIKPDIVYLLNREPETTTIQQTRYVIVTPDPVEDSMEDFEISKALIDIARNGSTDEQIAAFGFHWSHVARVLTHEAGSDARIALAVTQCVQNTMYRHPEWTPEDVISNYKYATPEPYISDEVEEAMERILILGQTYDGVGKATVFYNPNFNGTSDYHESQTLVAEFMTSYGPVRFFEEK